MVQPDTLQGQRFRRATGRHAGRIPLAQDDNDDEFFFVLSGRFIIDLEGRSVELLPNQGFVVPKGVLHCTRAPEKSVILMVETAAIVPTGDT